VKLFNFKNVAVLSAVVLVAILGTSSITNAQGRGNHGNDNWKQDRKDARQREKAAREQARIEQERLRAERQRQAEWTRRNSRITITRSTRTVGGTYYNVEPTVNVTEGRYRIYRNGSYYNMDNRGADMLRQAVNEGYRQGFAAGRSDYRSRRYSNWSNNTTYRTATYGYSSGVDRSQYQYYFQQGFQRGYQDGSDSRYQDGYTGNYQYGYNQGGTLNVLGAILGSILNLQSY